MSVSSIVSVHDNHGLRPFSDALAAINATDRSDVAHHLAVVLPAVAHLNAWLAGRPDREALSRRFYETCAEVDQGDIRKPLGYAGDYQVLDWIYTGHLSGGGRGATGTRCCTSFRQAARCAPVSRYSQGSSRR